MKCGDYGRASACDLSSFTVLINAFRSFVFFQVGSTRESVQCGGLRCGSVGKTEHTHKGAWCCGLCALSPSVFLLTPRVGGGFWTERKAALRDATALGRHGVLSVCKQSTAVMSQPRGVVTSRRCRTGTPVRSFLSLSLVGIPASPCIPPVSVPLYVPFRRCVSEWLSAAIPLVSQALSAGGGGGGGTTGAAGRTDGRIRTREKRNKPIGTKTRLRSSCCCFCFRRRRRCVGRTGPGPASRTSPPRRGTRSSV